MPIGARRGGGGTPEQTPVKFNAFDNARLVGELGFDFSLRMKAYIWAFLVRGIQAPP